MRMVKVTLWVKYMRHFKSSSLNAVVPSYHIWSVVSLSEWNVAFLNSHFHSLHVSNELHWNSNLTPPGLCTLPAPACHFNQHLKMTNIQRLANINARCWDRVLIMILISPSFLLSCQVAHYDLLCLCNHKCYFKPELHKSLSLFFLLFLVSSSSAFFISLLFLLSFSSSNVTK